MFKHIMLTIALASTLLPASDLIAQTDTSSQHTQIPQETWLGVMLGSIPPMLRSQLSPMIPDRQGVMVTSVEEQSPAAKSGLKRHDVILKMDDQKIYSARQLAELVRATAPNTRINLTVVHQAKVKNVPVTLASHALPDYGWRQPRPFADRHHAMPGPGSRHAPGRGHLPPGAQGNNPAVNVWDSFESVQVKTLPDGRYHAEVKYTDKKGDQKAFTFEGKRNEIVSQIKQQKDLPQDKKSALLNTLNMNPQNFFQRPFFRQNDFYGDPFADPFFQQGFPDWNLPDMQRFFEHPGTSPGMRGRMPPLTNPGPNPGAPNYWHRGSPTAPPPGPYQTRPPKESRGANQ